MSFSFIRCPECDEVIRLRRRGTSGKRHVPDSRKIRCEVCGALFRTTGETWREAHGEVE